MVRRKPGSEEVIWENTLVAGLGSQVAKLAIYRGAVAISLGRALCDGSDVSSCQIDNRQCPYKIRDLFLA